MGWTSHGLRFTAILVTLLPTCYTGPLHFSNGVKEKTRTQSELVSGIPFSVSEQGTTSMCELSFEILFDIIQSPSVSCTSLYDLVGSQVNISDTNNGWSFYANIGGDVYSIDANLNFNPTEETISDLTLCLTPTCFAGSSSSGALEFCLSYPQTSSSSSSRSSSSSFKSSYSSLSLESSSSSSSSSVSSSSSEMDCMCEDSSSSSSSSSSETLVLAFDSSPSSSSSCSSSQSSSSSSTFILAFDSSPSSSSSTSSSSCSSGSSSCSSAF